MDDNFPVLVNFQEFKELLIENKLFNDKSLSNLLSNCEKSSEDNENHLKLIIIDIESRDQIEIDRFAQIMRNSRLVSEELLKPSDQSDSSLNNLKTELLVRFKDLLSSPKACGEVLTVKKAKKIKNTKYGDVYDMTCRPRGFCVIIDNQHFGSHLPFRTGSRADADRLSDVFSQLDFDVLRFTNKTSSQMESLLKGTAQNPSLAQHNALAVIILSHGIRDEIYGTDGLTLAVDTILEFFNNRNCSQLRHKPKMFFLSACRGEKIDSGVNEFRFRSPGVNSLSGGAVLKMDQLPTWSDIFVYYSTIGGYASLRNTSTGSWFGYELAHSLAEFAHREHLHDLVTTKVGERLQERATEVKGNSAKQAMETQTKGRVKKLYFNPGLSVTQ